jgi:hypothetical protein
MSFNHHPNNTPQQPHTPGKIRLSARAPWRAYFYDHPLLSIDKAQSTTTGGRAKIYCLLCFENHLVGLKSQDANEVNTYQRGEARSHAVLTAYRTSDVLLIKKLTPELPGHSVGNKETAT